MSSTPLPRQNPKKENRRVYTRRRIDQLTYATFGPGNGGILLNLSEGGLSFQGIGAVQRDQLIPLSFKLPGMQFPIEASGEVVWSNDSGKGGGLRFLDLSEDARQRVTKWLTDDPPSAASFAGQPASHSGIVSAPATAETPVAPSPPAQPQKKALPEAAPKSPGLQQSKPAPVLTPAPVRQHIPPFEVPPAFAPPFMLADYPEARVRRTASPQFVVFATGVLAGCVGVLAAIAGVLMLVGPNRSSISEIGRPPAAMQVSNAESQDFPAREAVSNDKQLESSNQIVEAAPAASESVPDKTPLHLVGAVQPAAPRELNAKPPQVSQHVSPPKMSSPEVPNLALLVPRTPAAHSSGEIREPAAVDSAPPASLSVEAPRPVALALSDQPKPPKPAADKVDRSIGFSDAVLIQHDPPLYPPSAMKKHIEGLVTVSASVGTDGIPRELKLVNGDPTLAQAAEEAISHWRYVPAVFDGVPVESKVSITINFQPKP